MCSNKEGLSCNACQPTPSSLHGTIGQTAPRLYSWQARSAVSPASLPLTATAVLTESCCISSVMSVDLMTGLRSAMAGRLPD